MKYLFVLLLCSFFSAAALAQIQTVDDFEAGVNGWETCLPYGDVQKTTFTRGAEEGIDNSIALRINYKTSTDGLTHLVFYKNVDLDLSKAGGVVWHSKARNLPRTRLMGYLQDAEGRGVFYPLAAYNGENDQWMRSAISFQKDHPEGGGTINRNKITRIGVMVQSRVPNDGVILLDNLQITPPENGAWLTPQIITPNGDDVLDFTTVSVQAPTNTPVTITVQDAEGKILETLANKQSSTGVVMNANWKALQNGTPVKAGEYTVNVMFGDKEDSNFQLPVNVRHRAPWKPFKNQKQEYHPVGVFFEGAPVNAGYSENLADAKKYFDRCFKDIAEMGFDTVNIFWLPNHLWPMVFETAKANNLKLIFQISSLHGQIRGSAPLDEDKVEQSLKDIQEKTKDYPDVIVRYTSIDEPSADEMAKWVPVHRIMHSMLPDQPGISVVCSAASMKAMLEGIKLDEAVFDAYPQYKGLPAPSAGQFLGYLNGYRVAGGKRPLWAGLQSFESDSGWRYPLPVELQLSTYQALAAGSRGFLFFIYNSAPGSPENLKGLVDTEGNHTAIAPMASKLAKELRKVLPVLGEFPAESFEYQQGANVCIGKYTKPDGRNALIIANVDPANAFSYTIQVNAANGKYTDLLSDKTYTIEDQRLKVALSPAGAIVLVPVQ